MKYVAFMMSLVCVNVSFTGEREIPPESKRQIFWEKMAAHITKRNALLGYVDPEVAHIGRDPWKYTVQVVPPSNDPEIEFTGTRPRKP